MADKSDKLLNLFVLNEVKENYKEIFNEIEEKFKSISEAEENKLKEEVQKENEQFQKIVQNFMEMNQQSKILIEKMKDESVNLKLETQTQIKRMHEKAEEDKVSGIKKFATEIISIASIINLAKQSCQHDQNMTIGLDMISKKFIEILGKFQIKQIEINIGDDFDEKICEAISKDEGGKSGTISKIISYPYFFKDELLIFGQVYVY